MRLTDISVKNAAPRARTYKLTDGGGLVALVNPSGSKWWRLRYRFGGREKMVSLGTYPDVSLRQAREKADEARRVLADRRDPGYERLTEKSAEAVTFELIAKEWLLLQKKTLSPLTQNKARWMIESFVLPHLGKRPITHITAPEVLAVLKRIENKGHSETAHRTKQRISQIFRYAIAT